MPINKNKDLDMLVTENMSQKFVLARNKMKLKASEVAEMIGVTKQYISGIENSRGNISIKRLYQLSKIYNVDINYFLNESNPYDQLSIKLFNQVRDDSGKSEYINKGGGEIELLAIALVKILGNDNSQKLATYILQNITAE